MNILGIVLIAVAIAGPARAHLHHAAPVAGATVAMASLPSSAMISDDVPDMEAFGAELRATGTLAVAAESQPLTASNVTQRAQIGTYRPVGGVSDLDRAVGQLGGFRGAAVPVACKPPVFLAYRTVAAEELDPLLSPIALWEGGALGELRRRAMDAAGRNDQGGAETLTAQYWDSLSGAIERRNLFGAGKRRGDVRNRGANAGR